MQKKRHSLGLICLIKLRQWATKIEEYYSMTCIHRYFCESCIPFHMCIYNALAISKLFEEVQSRIINSVLNNTLAFPSLLRHMSRGSPVHSFQQIPLVRQIAHFACIPQDPCMVYN